MRTAEIHKQAKLDILGENSRKRFLSGYAKELQTPPVANAVQESYSTFIHQILGSTAYIFVSINLTLINIQNALARARLTNGRVLPANFIPYGQEYLRSIESGMARQDAEEVLWRKYIMRVNQKVLRSKFKRHGRTLRWVRVHENSTKRYSAARTNHMHLLLEVPTSQLSPRYSEFKIKQVVRKLFSMLICPLPYESKNCSVLNIRRGRLTGANAHTEYILKQVVNWDVAGDRVFTSGAQNITKR